MENLFIYIIVTTLLTLFLSPLSFGLGNKNNEPKIHFDSLVVDGHNDTMMKVIDEETWLPKTNIGTDTDFHIDIPKLNKGGLNIPFFAAYTHGYYDNNPKSISRTLALINALYWTEKNNRDSFKISTSVNEIKQVNKEGKIAGVPTIEGAYSINEDNYLGLLNQYYDLGIRALGFTWNYSNNLGEGASSIYGDPLSTPSPKGLTTLGTKVVLEMNKLGMVIDASHMSEQSFWDVISISKDPIIASHSGVHKLKKHQRNLTDEQLKALRDNRGVIGVVLYPEFLTDKKDTYIKDYVDHIDYIVNLIGVDHVGIGSDFDGASMPRDLEDSSEFYKITEELIRRNYSEEDIKKILGINMLRVLEEVESKHRNIKKDKDIYIIPEYKMGEIIFNSTPILKAKVESNNGVDINNLNYNIVLDGIYYKANYDRDTSTIYFNVKEPLREKFHVITFEAFNDKTINKQTRIFYINN